MDWNHRRLANHYDLVDAEICQQWPSYAKRDRVPQTQNGHHPFYCVKAIRGRYLRFQKDYENNIDDLLYPISLCEVQVFICQSGKYGKPVKDEWVCKDCTSCEWFCDNYYGCANPAFEQNDVGKEGWYQLVNAAIHRVPTQYSSTNDHYPPRMLVDGVARFLRDWYCWMSLPVPGSHFIRVELDGIWLIAAIRVTTYKGEEELVRHMEANVAYRVGEPTSSRMPDEQQCWKLEGAINEALYTKVCKTCSKPGSHADCPRGRFVTIYEKNLPRLTLCELEAMGLPVKEVAVGQPCLDGCKLVLCRWPLKCHNKRCKSPLGGPCTTQTDCLDSNAKCSNRTKKCSLPLSAGCGDKEGFCDMGLVCDAYDNTCKY
jgi:hypothetical protein